MASSQGLILFLAALISFPDKQSNGFLIPEHCDYPFWNVSLPWDIRVEASIYRICANILPLLLYVTVARRTIVNFLLDIFFSRNRDIYKYIVHLRLSIFNLVFN